MHQEVGYAAREEDEKQLHSRRRRKKKDYGFID